MVDYGRLFQPNLQRIISHLGKSYCQVLHSLSLAWFISIEASFVMVEAVYMAERLRKSLIEVLLTTRCSGPGQGAVSGR